MYSLLRCCSLVVAIAILSSAIDVARAGGDGKDTGAKGYTSKGDVPTNVHVHYVHVPKLCHHLCGPPPPDVPVVESAAIRRVEVPTRTSFRVQQEAGQLRPQPEAGEATCGTDKTSDFLKLRSSNGKLDDVDRRLKELDTRLDGLLKLVESHQEAIKMLAEKKDP